MKTTKNNFGQIHEAVSPFPWTRPDGTEVLGEVCSCRHGRKDHFDRGPAWGHANCYRCGCSRFTWVSFIERSAALDKARGEDRAQPQARGGAK